MHHNTHKTNNNMEIWTFVNFQTCTYASSMNFAASIMLVIRSRCTLREVNLISVCWRNLSTYMCANTKQDGLQPEYLKIRSMYLWTLRAGALKPWNTVITSFICFDSNSISFLWTDLSRSEERSDKTRGTPTPLSNPLSPNERYISELTSSVSSARVPICKLQKNGQIYQ